jgi:prophage regulatory protein
MEPEYIPIKERILRLPEVKRRVSLCTSSIYKMISEKQFPKQISLGNRCVGWLESEIDDWMVARIQFGRDER